MKRQRKNGIQQALEDVDSEKSRRFIFKKCTLFANFQNKIRFSQFLSVYLQQISQ